MSLQQWLDDNLIHQARPTPDEVQSLLAVSRREIADAAVQGISLDGRFEHAYESVRSAAQAALLAEGFAVPRHAERGHEVLIRSLAHTVGLEVGKVDYLDICRRSWEKVKYERSGLVQRAEADRLLREAPDVLEHVKAWLAERHPELSRRR